MNIDNTWLALIISLPTTNATARMRIWRTLKNLGCGVLRDGVYLLPNSDTAALSFEQQGNEVIKAGGTAQVVKLISTQGTQEISFRKLFERTNDYATLKQDIDAFFSTLSIQNLTASKRALKSLARDFAIISSIDFFPGPARDQIATLLGKATTELSAVSNPDEPQATKGKIKKLKRDDFHKRIWATRKRIWIDRMASAWLIKRFIDPAARFKWLNKPQDCPQNALGFDFDGANFTHVGSQVTFEVLLESFIHESDPALERLAGLVHYLDAGGIPVAEAHGLELILKGMRKRCTNDDELFIEASKIFNDMYLSYSNEENNHEQ